MSAIFDISQPRFQPHARLADAVVSAVIQLAGFNPTRAWQTLMRWLLYFLSLRYERVPSRHSEVLRRTQVSG